jgi:16S rRNA processing protein RimM
MGRVLAPYGVAGWLKVEAYTEAPDGLLEYEEWRLRAPGGNGWSVHTLAQGRMHGGVLLVQLSGVADREQAFALRGMEVGVPRSALPAAAEDEVYWADLVGFRVVNRESRELGEVASVTAHGAHPLLRVARKDGGPERLIPYVPAVIDAVDMPARRIEVDWGEDY